MRRQNLFALCGTADPWLAPVSRATTEPSAHSAGQQILRSRACRATTLPRGTLRDSRSFARARAARSLRMTAPRGFGRRRREGDFSPPEASEPVILSAAGAKDLLSAVPDARPQQNRRSRAARALAQDDSAARLKYEESEEEVKEGPSGRASGGSVGRRGAASIVLSRGAPSASTCSTVRARARRRPSPLGPAPCTPRRGIPRCPGRRGVARPLRADVASARACRTSCERRRGSTTSCCYWARAPGRADSRHTPRRTVRSPPAARTGWR